MTHSLGKKSFNAQYQNIGPKQVDDNMINMALKMPKSYRCSLTSEIKKHKVQHTEGKNRFPDPLRLSPLPGSGAVPVSSYQMKLR
jgi:hypothetical protein